jgi:hypothetical protein
MFAELPTGQDIDPGFFFAEWGRMELNNSLFLIYCIVMELS